MARSRVRDIEVNPHFYVPTGIVDVRQENLEDGIVLYDPEILVEAGENPTIETPGSVITMPSSGFRIVEQRVRPLAGGGYVVDAILEFVDIEGVEDIDVKVAKT